MKTAKNSHLSGVHALILAGGQSSRLFPFNKVLSDLTGSNRTLLQQAFDRVTRQGGKGRAGSFISPQRIHVLTSQAMVPPMAKQLGLPKENFFSDPARRGTWPAVLWAMAHLRRENREAILTVLTADHVIPDVQGFQTAVSQAVAIARREPAVVLVGISPSANPEKWLSFGAVRPAPHGEPGSSAHGSPIAGFEEKPPLERAQEMIQEGSWSWNAGMLVFRLSTAEKALRAFMPVMYDTYQSLAQAVAQSRRAAAERFFAEFPAQILHPLDLSRQVDNTIDYAVITPLIHRPSDLKAFLTARCLDSWTDLGQWTALREVVRPDRRDNIVIGRVAAGPTVKHCILAAAQGWQMKVSGLQRCIAAVCADTLLVIAEGHLSEAKSIAALVQQSPQERLFQLQGAQGAVQCAKGRVVLCGVQGVDVRMQGRRIWIEGGGFIG